MSPETSGRYHLGGFFLVLLLPVLVGCHAQSQIEKTELLEEAKVGETHFSPYQPTNPYAQVSANLLERQIFQTTGPENVTVKVLDLYVLPTKTAEKVSLPGAAVLEVKYGEGKLVLPGNQLTLSFGSISSVPQDTTFSIENKSKLPLIIRARTFVAP